jgi:high affinity Mn2+ porin
MKGLFTLLIALLCPVLTWASENEDWNLKFQSTYIWQGKPPLRSPYDGPHSLNGSREKSYSFTGTAAVGLRLGTSTELYVDPEVAQGVPLSGLQGLAGFTNGEMARSSGPNPTLYRARFYFRHVIGLSEETVAVESAMNQLASTYAKRRWVLTVGNLAIPDIFDANAYAHDPRTQFMNWALMSHAAYDYAADSRGYSWGLAAEYLADDWTIRAGRFIQPKEPNQLALDTRIGVHYGDQVELEKRYDLGQGRPGAVRLLAFRNRAVMSRYDDALALTSATGGAPDIDQVRRGPHIKYGLGVNFDQRLTTDLGVFGRAMWADGKTETYAFTQADRSASFGASLTGNRWARAKDVIGIAFAQNWLSRPDRDVLARGGQTFFLGDGALRYRPEMVFEAYYLVGLKEGIAISFDVQRITNPGYNADRGPAIFYGVRAHLEN